MAGASRQGPAVVLVGFMGAGKNAVGHELAARLGLPFLDTDALIVERGGPIAEIFAAQGEDGFRQLETEVVLREVEALQDAPKVLALGGGAVLSERVRRALREVSRVGWLTAPADELWRRVAAAEGRPLARDEQSFRDLLTAREALYREVATVVQETSGRTPAEAADSLAAAVRAGAGRVQNDPGRREGAA